MPPTVALGLWFVLLLTLLVFDPAKEPKTSLALWLPIAWMFIVATRFPTQWMNFAGGLSTLQGLQEGDPMDRMISALIILLAFGVLLSRSFKWGGFIRRNAWLMAYLVFALVSVVWSDFTLIALKRWFRDLGHYFVILVILTDPDPLLALRAVFRRLGYLMIPLSFLLAKYYPLQGMQFNPWTGAAMFVGPSTSKNGLGVICLVAGIYFLWDTVARWSERKKSRTKLIILVNIVFFALSFRLLLLANSATCRVCFGLACVIIFLAHTRMIQRNPGLLKAMIPLCLCLYPILAFGLNLNAEMVKAVGRDPTFTERTEIWQLVLSMHTNPIIGTGYESFWLGSRLATVWASHVGSIAEAHDGYLEVYLNLGVIGLTFLVGFLISSYLKICKLLKPFTPLASFALAIWTVTLFYNVTEAAFKWHFMWLSFLPVAMTVPWRVRQRAPAASLVKGSVMEEPADIRLGPTEVWDPEPSGHQTA